MSLDSHLTLSASAGRVGIYNSSFNICDQLYIDRLHAVFGSSLALLHRLRCLSSCVQDSHMHCYNHTSSIAIGYIIKISISISISISVIIIIIIVIIIIIIIIIVISFVIRLVIRPRILLKFSFRIALR